MNFNELISLGLPQNCIQIALETFKSKGMMNKPDTIRCYVEQIVDNPDTFINGGFHKLALGIIGSKQESTNWANNPCQDESGVAPYKVWGEKPEQNVTDQMNTACELPVAVQGALMGDFHLGYGLPIGGVLATWHSVIPYAVGVDIACRMKCTITDLPVEKFNDMFSPEIDPFITAIQNGTVFGMGGEQQFKAGHPVMDMDWNITAITKKMKDRAWAQLGTSGSGNHFVEFGIVTITEQTELGLAPGKYVALLSHSGSRGAGANVCKTYHEIAQSKLPKQYERFKNLAWLPLESEPGQEYWNAMNLMGEYASANHHVIHHRVLTLAGAKPIKSIENHHNFAWKERYHNLDFIVHRKGATPTPQSELGIIPGSMADPAFLVRGKGNEDSLRSASHGAGRRMSRTQAIKNFNWAEWDKIIKSRGVRVISCGLDEVPGSYKDIRDVMNSQTDLVDIIGRFDPKLVKMADDGTNED